MVSIVVIAMVPVVVMSAEAMSESVCTVICVVPQRLERRLEVAV